MNKRNRYPKHDINKVMNNAISRNKQCYVFATIYGYTISNSKPPYGQSYYSVNGANVNLVEVKFGN